MRSIEITTTVNDVVYRLKVSPRQTAADLIREDLQLTGTHLGCEHGACGACTVLLDGHAVRSCLLYAPQLDGANVTTVEALAAPDGTLHPIQAAFAQNHALQCGFCSPGFVLAVHAFLNEVRSPTRDQVRAALSGNLCRCTGYQGIVDAVLQADREWER